MKRIVFMFVLFVFGLLPITSIAAGPAYNWTGLYAGLQGSYSDGDTDWTYLAGGYADHDIDGWMGGFFAGYNYQFPFNLVVGVETDINGGKISGSTSCPNPTWGCGSEISWAGSTRARVGYAIYRFLPYVAAGVAYSSAKVYTQSPTGTDYNDKNMYIGWTPAAGLEFAITSNLLARLEYTYYDFGKERSEVDSGLLVDAKIKFHTIKFGLSWKF